VVASIEKKFGYFASDKAGVKFLFPRPELITRRGLRVLKGRTEIPLAVKKG
jgi:hypothetical protein